MDDSRSYDRRTPIKPFLTTAKETKEALKLFAKRQAAKKRKKGSFGKDFLDLAEQLNDQVCNKWIKRIDEITKLVSQYSLAIKSVENAEKVKGYRLKRTELSQERARLYKDLRKRADLIDPRITFL